MEQRSNETKEEFAQRRQREAIETGERLHRMYEFAPEPRDLYVDDVKFDERYGVLRINFGCSRPETDDGFGDWIVPVARLSIPLVVFKHAFETWLASDAGRDATTG